MVERGNEATSQPGDASMAAAAELHDPERRRLIFVRGAWEVRSPPGCCALGPSWLLRGMWHLQFFAPVSGLSILAFQSGSVVGPFIVRSGDQGEAFRMDALGLDQHLVVEWGLAPSSHAMMNLVHLMEDKAVGCLLRMRAGALAHRNDNDRLGREMA